MFCIPIKVNNHNKAFFLDNKYRFSIKTRMDNIEKKEFIMKRQVLIGFLKITGVIKTFKWYRFGV